jgi:hypothetical protein
VKFVEIEISELKHGSWTEALAGLGQLARCTPRHNLIGPAVAYLIHLRAYRTLESKCAGWRVRIGLFL